MVTWNLALPDPELHKERHYHHFDRYLFCLDIFEGPLRGLIRCEMEADSAQQLHAIESPDFARIEVTASSFFNGGALASASAEQLHREREALVGRAQ